MTTQKDVSEPLTEEPLTEEQTNDFASLFSDETKIILPTQHPVWMFVLENEKELRLFAQSLFKPNDPERESVANCLVLQCALEIDWAGIDLDNPTPRATTKRRFNTNGPKKNNEMSFFKKRLQWRFKDYKGFTTRHPHDACVRQHGHADHDVAADTMHTQEYEESIMQNAGEDQDASEDTMHALVEGDEQEQEQLKESTTWMYDEDDDGDIVAYDDEDQDFVYHDDPGGYDHYLHDEAYKPYYDLARQELMGEIYHKYLARHATYLKKNRRGDLFKRMFIDGQSYAVIKRLLQKPILSERSIYNVVKYLEKEGAKNIYDDLRREYHNLSEEDIAIRAHAIHRECQKRAWAEEKKQNPWKDHTIALQEKEPPTQEEPSTKP